MSRDSSSKTATVGERSKGHHHAAAHISVWVPAPMEAQQALVAALPDRYWVPPYVGHKGWVAVVLDTRPDWAEVAALVREAFWLVAP